MTVKVFRGVHAKHPQLAAARRGEAVPGNAAGKVTAAAHNLGGQAQHSPFTSWTHDRQVAVGHALGRGAGGVVLEVDEGPPAAGDQWSWELSPDVWREQEVLLRGHRSGLGVTPP